MTAPMRLVPRPSPNHGPRPAGARVDLLVLHYTGMPTAGAALARLCDPAAEVSAHYTIDTDGAVYAHVPEDRRAWHAGRSFWRGDRDVNSRSIGIELVNPGHEHGYVPFPEPQMAALVELAKGVAARHAIPPDGVVGHSDVAPARKEDPGELFDWRRLAAHGLGLWPDIRPEDAAPGWTEAEVRDLLARYGYDADEPRALLAFQRRFVPDRLTGRADDRTAAALRALVRLSGR